jgi:hypothetical protein
LQLPAPWSSAGFAAHLQRRGLGVVTADAFATGDAHDCVRVALGAAPGRPTLVKALEILRQSLTIEMGEQVV